MTLVLTRHGNTFAATEPVVWVGAGEDPALTDRGRAQAEALGQALAPLGSCLQHIAVSPMARTQEHARCALQALGAPLQLEVQVDGALRELHYGAWAGRGRQAIANDAGGAAGGGEIALRAWESQGLYPAGAGFSPPRQEKLAALEQFLRQARARHRLQANPSAWSWAVTHGGVLRLLAVLLRSSLNVSASALPKVACGNSCVVSWQSDHTPHAVAWDVPPGAALARALAQAVSHSQGAPPEGAP